jgi:hypothetical protein
VFVAFASFGSRALVAELDAVKLVKLVRAAGLLGGPVTSAAVDLMFAHAKSRGARRVTFEQFITVLAGIAERKVRGCCLGWCCLGCKALCWLGCSACDCVECCAGLTLKLARDACSIPCSVRPYQLLHACWAQPSPSSGNASNALLAMSS